MDEASLAREYSLLRDLPNGCRFYKVDLHVHSPGSFDFADEVADTRVKKQLREMSGEEFAMAWLDAGYDLIAITDHNGGAFLNAAVEGARAVKNSSGRALTILPGVELTVHPGIHVLAVFPFQRNARSLIDDLLSALDLAPNERGKPESLIEKGMAEVTEEVQKRSGILIAAHCNSTKGLVQDITGQARVRALRAVDALENSLQCADPVKTIAYVREQLHCALPFLVGSDNHDPRNIADTMWVKMAAPDFNGVKQILFEPALRACFAKPAAVEHPRITGCTTTQGLYASERFAFSPNLNVLIGGRGAGKSALIDLLRFAFEVEPAESNDRRTYGERISDFLQGVGEVIISAIGRDGEPYVITRSGAFSPDKKLGPKFTERPQVFQVVADGLVLRAVRPRDILPIEFYAQGEVANLTNRVAEQLRLIDENLDLDELKREEADCTRLAESLEEEIVGGIADVNGMEHEIDKVEGLRARAQELGQRLDAPVFNRDKMWTDEQALIRTIESWAPDMRKGVQGEPPELRLPPIDLEKSPNADLINHLLADIQRTREEIGRVIGTAQDHVEDLTEKIRAASELWANEFSRHREEYRKELADLGAANLAAVAAEHQSVEQEVGNIEHVLLPKRDEVRRRVEELRKKRDEVIEKLASMRQELNRRRLELVNQLNEQLGGIVRIEFDPAGDREDYFNQLAQLLEGSGMINREAQVAGLCERLTPLEFIRALRNKDTSALCDVAGLTAANATTLLRHVRESDVMMLERVDIPSTPRILLKREGEAAYSELSRLSVGEKCSAVLSVALLTKGKPLVIDQPEDELDHAFVTESIVESIRAVKGVRQIIAATHNPNIPVLGDAEMVFRLSHRPGAGICEIKARGGIEEVAITTEVQMLEGGAEAFERRRRKYAGSVR